MVSSEEKGTQVDLGYQNGFMEKERCFQQSCEGFVFMVSQGGREVQRSKRVVFQ